MPPPGSSTGCRQQREQADSQSKAPGDAAAKSRDLILHHESDVLRSDRISYASSIANERLRAARMRAAQLRALAHPLRLQLLHLLHAEGPATATQLAHRLGESTGSTSYHLRALHRAG